jgi:hypothetical protein
LRMIAAHKPMRILSYWRQGAASSTIPRCGPQPSVRIKLSGGSR